jgi:hypothetical protein
VVNKEFQKDIKKYLDKTTVKSELEAGATPRRYDPACGVKKHNERIHRESEYADKYKNLPFEFSKPKKAKRQTVKVCANCGKPVHVSVDCIGLICRGCGKYSAVEEVEIDA